jgi:hypothetical protein
VKFTDARLLFDSAGNPRQSYIETLDGPLIVDAPPGGIDVKTGLIRKPLTADKLRAINIGKTSKRGATGDSNHYFNAHDGGNKVWFVQGSCEARNAEGFDDRGRRLVPATAEWVEHCEDLRAQAEQRRQKDAEKQARRELYQKQKARKREFREIGVYTAIGRFTVLDGVKITFEECVVLRHETRLKFRVSRLRDVEAPAVGVPRFEFSLLNADGTETRASSLHRIQGMIAITSQDRALLPPNPGESGRAVVEFQRNSESGGFAIAVNSAVVFSNPSGHIVRFRKF